jgi:hypothetical protein
VLERERKMGQIVKKKKKGRPSKADLARRAEEVAAAEMDLRRSLRRRNVRYNIDYDDYLDEDDEDEEDERRRERKLKLLMKLNQGSELPAPVPGGARSESREGHASEDECERKPLKKRRIGNGRDDEDEEQEEDDDDDHGGVGGEDEEVCTVSLYGSDQRVGRKRRR